MRYIILIIIATILILYSACARPPVQVKRPNEYITDLGDKDTHYVINDAGYIQEVKR